MADETINTGGNSLDEVIGSLVALSSQGTLKLITDRLADTSLSEEDFAKELPPHVLGLAAVLSSTPSYTNLLEAVPDSAHPAIKRAKQIVDAEMPEILSHPFAARILAERAKDEASRSGLGESLKVISRLECLLTWVGSPPNLLPVLRVAFLNNRDELVLDSSLAWSDVLRMTSTLLALTASSMKETTKLAELEQIRLHDPVTIIKSVKMIEDSLARLRDWAPVFGLDLGPDRANAPDTDDQAG